MNLDEACSEFEGLFAAVKVDKDFAGGSVILCSGAIGVPDRPPPVICATPALAIELWKQCALAYAGEIVDPKRKMLIWITEPQLLNFKMTMQDAMGAQRVATPRFAVYSLCAISEQPQDAVPESPKSDDRGRGCLNTGAAGAKPTTKKPRHNLRDTAKSRTLSKSASSSPNGPKPTTSPIKSTKIG